MVCRNNNCKVTVIIKCKYLLQYYLLNQIDVFKAIMHFWGLEKLMNVLALRSCVSSSPPQPFFGISKNVSRGDYCVHPQLRLPSSMNYFPRERRAPTSIR